MKRSNNRYNYNREYGRGYFHSGYFIFSKDDLNPAMQSSKTRTQEAIIRLKRLAKPRITIREKYITAAGR